MPLNVPGMNHNQQLTKHLKWTLAVKWRLYTFKRKLGSCGKVFFENNVRILRYPKNVHLGNHLVIKEGARICSCNEKAIVTIGDNTTFGYHTFLFASAGITIGSNCLIAPFVYIVDSDHGISRDQRINQQPNTSEAVFIGNDVWIGTGAKILKGVTIGEGAIVAAGALVNSDIQPYEIYGGIPAKKIGERQ